jgi:pimeloyl-ACP methyl ester carboxylesterase
MQTLGSKSTLETTMDRAVLAAIAVALGRLNTLTKDAAKPAPGAAGNPWLNGQLTLALLLAALASLVVAVSDAAAQSRYIRHTDSARSVIVFVHGVLSDSIAAWTNTATKAYWPTLLTEDSTFQDEDIYVYEYATPSMREAFSIDEIADNMRLQFDSDKVTTGHDQIIFLAHSMGGLAVRAYLLKYRDVAKKTKMIYFFPVRRPEVKLVQLLHF